MRTTLTLLLFTVGLSAAAQAQGQMDPSGDPYRRGYQEGYQAGFRDGLTKAAQDAQQPGPRPLACRRIIVLGAQYGTPRQQCDATRAIAKLASGRYSATVRASNNLCGDPAPGKGKDLSVEYACGDPAFCGRQILKASASENRSTTLACPS